MPKNYLLAMELGMTHHVVFHDTEFPSVFVNGMESALKACNEYNPHGKNTIQDLVAIKRLTDRIKAI